MKKPRDDADARFIAEALPAFIGEAEEQVERIEQLLLQLEAVPADRDLLGALFRCAHTVKGSAGIFGLDEIVAFTHHVETLLDQLRGGRVAFDAALGTLLLRCNDQIRRLVDVAAGRSAEGIADERDALVAELQARSGDGAAAAPPTPAATAARPAGPWQVTAAFGPETFRNGMDPMSVLNYLRGVGTVSALACDAAAVPALDALDPESCHLAFAFEIAAEGGRAAIEDAFSFVIEDCRLHIEPIVAPTGRLGEILLADGAVSPEQLERALGQQARQRDAGAGTTEETRFIRVQADRLDAVINLLGELVVASAGAELLARPTRNPALVEATQLVGRLVEEVRNGTLQLRMVPIGETFARFRRVVRDTAAELGKDVALEIVGAETELDKSMVERIADPLMHIVRNALDHGLETAAQRADAGKPAQGRLTLAAAHESGGILIRISDDGRGVCRDKVLRRARERGLLAPDAKPSDDAILQLLFEPGFSTAEAVTSLSGRGVGMDVVRRNVEALRGTVAVDSVEGRGTSIEIRLPLTLAIIDGFLVGVGASRFVFPLESVVEVIESRATRGIDPRGRGIAELRGQPLPIVDLRRLYALPLPAPARSSIVVIQAGGRRYGVVVDQLLGQQQTVIKPLGRMFRSLRGMSGSSILGNGEVALIFDVHSLGQFAVEAATAAPRSPATHSLEGQPS